LDEVNIYVHTPKEPVNEFHEEINAMKTIIKFQAMFNQLTPKEKKGFHGKQAGLKKWLDSMPKIGYSYNFLKHATLHYKENRIPDNNTIGIRAMTEELNVLESTKAVIGDRKKVATNLKMKYNNLIRIHDAIKEGRYKRGHLTITEVENRIKEVEKSLGSKEAASMRSMGYKKINTKIYHSRIKVHDILYKYYEQGYSTVASKAIEILRKGDHTPIVDICIKAQYGAKREFYVMDMKSKVIARVAESIYKSICKLSTTEMISVPGDDKLLYMQSMVDKAYGVAGKSNAMVYFVNGDCTKWSASETMESFMCMTEFIMDPKLANICNGVFDLWMKKKIQFPFRIIKNSVAISEHTKYLKLDEKDQSLLSTQNFLQRYSLLFGMETVSFSSSKTGQHLQWGV
jgi:hypothetical protein